MRYLKLFESFENRTDYLINELCKFFNIKDYTINSDKSIDVNEDVNLININKLKKLPLKFNKVNGNFLCSKNELITLEGSPIEINGGFYCSFNELTSFEFAPKIIRGIFSCQYNNIKTFEYFPIFIEHKYFLCDNNPIYQVWRLFWDKNKIELLNDFDIFRDEDTDEPAIIMDRLNDFLITIGREPVEKVEKYKNI